MYAGKSITETSPAIVRDGLVAQWKNNFTTLGLKGNVHFTERRNLDIYGGFLLACHFSKIELEAGEEETLARHIGIKPHSATLAWSGFIGTRYAFSGKLSVFGEVGYGISLATIGLGYRLF